MVQSKKTSLYKINVFVYIYHPAKQREQKQNLSKKQQQKPSISPVHTNDDLPSRVNKKRYKQKKTENSTIRYRINFRQNLFSNGFSAGNNRQLISHMCYVCACICEFNSNSSSDEQQKMKLKPEKKL